MFSKLEIRLAEIQDLPAIVNIYNQAIRSKKATGDLDEFTVESRYDWFHKFDIHNFPLYVAVSDDQIIGYATLSPYRPGRKAMHKIAEVSFYIDYSYHNLGVGSHLLEYVISDCDRIGKECLLAILLDSNISSINLLRKFKFKEWGHLPGIIDVEGTMCGQFIYGLKLK